MDKQHEDSHAEDEMESFIEEEENRSSGADKRDVYRGKEKDSLDQDRGGDIGQGGYSLEGRFQHRER